MDDFDFFSEAFRYDPKAEYARMRTECPLARTSVPFDWYAVTLQADVQQMLRNYKLWSSEHGPGLAFAGGGALVSVDPPQHTSDRRLVQEAFTADTLLAMEPDIRQLVNDEMDKWVTLGKGDLMELLGTPVPLIVIAWLLGLDVDYCREIRPRADGVISLHADGQSGQPPKERNANREEEIHYFRREIAERRIYPAIDINRSGTRKEELLFTPEELNRVTLLRTFLADMPEPEAIEFLLKQMSRSRNNKEFFVQMREG